MATGVHHILGAEEIQPKSVVEDHASLAPSPSPTLNGSKVANGLSDTNGHTAPKAAVDSDAEPSFKLGDFCVDDYRPMKVAVIGTGFSGICAGIRFPQYIENLELSIYDKNAGVGGTWYSNRYPGLACDIPSHCYQLTFEANTQWSAFYAPGPEIRKYLEGVVEKYQLMKYIKLQHELVHARWNPQTSQWHLKLRRPSPNNPSAYPEVYEEIEDVADVVLAGTGTLSRWSWPDIEGLKDYRGLLLHSASWDLSDENGQWQEGVKDWGNKRVGVIGVGSSALQIVPALQSRVSKLYNYVRGKTWLSPPFASDKLAELMKRDPTSENYVFTEEDKERFRDLEYYKEFRHELESELNAVHTATLRGSEMQKNARRIFKENMQKRLAKKPWIADHIIPDFSVACRRLTPGPGYLEAICQDNVEFVTTHIKRITPTGIELVDGTHHELDVLICATGYDTSFQYPFTVEGKDGVTLNDRFKPHPETYLTLCVDGFPNWFMSLGPNSGVGSGSLLVIIEKQVEYVTKVLQKLQRERLRSIEAKKEAVKDFDEYLEAYFPTTVYSEKCRSWYKMGKEEGRVVGLWPGSCLHAVRAMLNPRWEDYDYEYLDDNKTKNRFHWLGDGCTHNEKYFTGDRAWYLNDEYVDIPPVPKRTEPVSA